MTIDEFNNLVKENEITLVDNFAEWCGPCKVLSTTLESLEKKHPEIKIIKIDIEEEPDIANHFRIRSVPTLLYFKDGELKDKTVGSLSEQSIMEKIQAL